MELTNEFTVAAPVDHTWAVLTDLEQIAPCMPGAQLEEVEGDEYRGVIKVKVGPISAQYKGAASFVSKDDAAHTAVLKAEGRDTRGQGNASATITAKLTPAGEGTKVVVDTDLHITGKVAQMGRGVLADVSAKLLDQFVKALEADVIDAESGPASSAPSGNGSAAPAADAPSAAPTAPSAGPRKIEGPEAKPIDLLDASGAPLAKRVGPIVGILVVVLWLLRRRAKRRR